MNRLRSRLVCSFVAMAAALGLAPDRSIAHNIDMSTLPGRDKVELTIYNAEDLTLVRELREVTVRKGLNELQFSWANTLIDPTSVQLRFPAAKSDIELIDTRFPMDRPQALYWSVRSEQDGSALAEISYFTSGISWAADYVGVVEGDANTMAFDGFVTIINNSGEDYENASVRMVVGTINLVEKVAELARRAGRWNEATAGSDDLALGSVLKLEVARDALSEAGPGGYGGGGGGLAKAKQIVKEGLSEYFLFSVPGEETVKNGWSKRMRLFGDKSGLTVPFKTEYRYRPQEYGDQLVRMYLVRNDEASTLGESPLPDGAVRLFRKTKDDGLSVLAFLSTKYVPIGQEFEFNLGRDPEVILERLVLEQSRTDFWFQRNNDQRLYSPDKGDRIDPSYAMSGWNDRARRVERIRNYRGEPVTVAFRYGLDGDVTFRSGLKPTLFDFRTPEFGGEVKAGATLDLPFEVVVKQGTNAKEQHVELVPLN